MRRITAAVAGLGLLVVALATGLGAYLSEPGHQGPITDHFDGTTFENTLPTALPSVPRGVRYALTRERGHWDDWVEVAPQPDPPLRVQDLRVTFVNHATTLVQIAGMNLLLDPIWSDRCSAVQWAGPARHHAPGLRLDQLPPIDAILISHNHYDHLDLDTLEALKSHGAPILTGLGNGDILRRSGHMDVVELDWGGEHILGPLTVIGQEVRHFSSRGLLDRNQTLWLGFVIDSPVGAVYFAGDTGDGPHFAESGARQGPFRLAILPIGAFAPRWFMAPVHIDPRAAVAAHQALGAQHSVGVHFGTFRLSDEARDDPPRLVAEAAAEAGLGPDAFWVLAPGEGRDVPALR
ncbi:MAG: L-ascorbate metabolism protein UlaG (beta-lactamase superfamily) [Myxococcota bacterium]|jgi:L-ascorbate metabolism protein UlaG (beta-lactamase superfamily)